MRPRLQLSGNQCALITETDGLYVIEPMRFVSLWEARKQANPRPTHNQIPWCPHELRPLYKRLRAKGLRASEARPLVEEHIASRCAG